MPTTLYIVNMCVSDVSCCSPKFVVTMNEVDDKYKTDLEKEVTSNEASDDGECKC